MEDPILDDTLARTVPHGVHNMTEVLKETPLHDAHVALRGKMVPFAGFSMPVQYPTGIVAEHTAVR